jgi:hypothetical protein
VKASIGEQVHDIDATVVVDFKPVVQSTKLQAEIGKKTEGKVIAENVTSYSVVTQPTLGVLNFDSKTGAFDYTPNADTVGKTDSFTVRGTYLLGGDPNKSYVSEVATVSIDIVPESFCQHEPDFQHSNTARYLNYVCYYDQAKTKLKAKYYHYPAPSGYSQDDNSRYVTYLKIFPENPLHITGIWPVESYSESINRTGFYKIQKLDRAVTRDFGIYRTESAFAGGESWVTFAEQVFESDTTDETIVYTAGWTTSDQSPVIDGDYSSVKTATTCNYQKTVLGPGFDPDQFRHYVWTKRLGEAETKQETSYDSCQRSPKPERDLVKEKLAAVKAMYKLRFPDSP